MILMIPHFSALNYFCGNFATDVVDWPKIPLGKNKAERPLEESSCQSSIITQDKRLKTQSCINLEQIMPKLFQSRSERKREWKIEWRLNQCYIVLSYDRSLFVSLLYVSEDCF